ncbi:cell envelope integrity protein TolA [Acidovorax sp. 210-6]|uniref:cell envelope integrity protein TolA n=1 Tax=Acidovorax sp. 210-6 TaxID=2699468 RepID=UPI00138944EF|nr:cell envelope integrity protein TolA [Acidovorax sp. 210-6]NCU66591.1 cell envelope integrity protein TolA [Acidovorax sp. 210-6]
MHAHDDRDELAPPTPPARLRAIALAVLAHVLLIVALTWGVHWKTSTDQPAVQAELWAAVPQQAAPRADPPPEPTPPPPPVVAPPPPPPPPPVRQAEPDTREADLAIEREKKRLEKERKEREQLQERQRLEKERKEQERKAQELKDKDKQREKEHLEKERQEKDKRLAEEKKQKEAEAKRKQEAIEKANAQAAEARRQENLRRMQGLAGATGAENATGTALRDAGPSGSYGGKVAAKVKPHIVYPDAVAGNPRAEVEVRAAPDGTITSTRLVQSSGNKAWDDAVLRALQKTETLPRDVDGRVPSVLVIGFRPKD